MTAMIMDTGLRCPKLVRTTGRPWASINAATTVEMYPLCACVTSHSFSASPCKLAAHCVAQACPGASREQVASTNSMHRWRWSMLQHGHGPMPHAWINTASARHAGLTLHDPHRTLSPLWGKHIVPLIPSIFS